ncbi:MULTISPECIES: adenylyltransferase/cytidyltransferase family protein [unclassified Rhodococcus (in: high G+C Gram-positive bacteria)]|uniref:adenylyltransferase/cytidyltransferase family protein n=1 Tax=unclassified Rhodococcus (in: high G+C Gram-positive bacteria) TaxID=192944 RepID=UPI00233EA708|nr:MULTISPECIES: adenylyltransferase/cytidyltransferase family protein [unclassified Rhodococcus (in: high G+C Gram-positive bacteria)]MDC3728145.1 adenylyltransferase/cytidyltransferase family protein [Rhodococcus sp. Rp3]WSE25453.1 adenylyltransferase/cytidyltransferase family protein [Rhodococcus sp. PD04]
MTEFGCVTGRFQPVHNQHMELFEIALNECDHLVVAITNPDPSAHHEEASSAHRHTRAANPFTYFERARLLDAALTDHVRAGRVTIVPFDLTQPQLWPQYVPHSARHFVRVFSDWEHDKARWLAQAGYAVTVVDGDPVTKLNATDIRQAMLAGDDSWRHHVPTATVALLSELIATSVLEEQP